MRDIPIDADRLQQEGNLVTGQESINAPAGALFIRGIQVYDSTSSIAGANTWLEKKDVTYLQEYVSSTESSKRGKPKYYSMYGGATGNTDGASGRMFLAPVPDATYKFRVHYNKMPATLASDNTTNYISLNFPNGLLGFLFGAGFPVNNATMVWNKNPVALIPLKIILTKKKNPINPIIQPIIIVS